MVFSILVIVFVAIIAYFHFVQGFFSATLSAFAAVVAALLAVGYDETLVHLLLRGTGADNIHSLCLVMIFVVTYVVLRLVFDRLIPGNVRIPATINYVGAALMGLVAGICAMGIFAVAVQMLPFDGQISWLGGARWNMLPGRDVVLPAQTKNGRDDDAKIRDQMEEDTFDPAKEQHGLLFPADDLVMNAAAYVSGGSLSTDRPLESVHPDWLGELFAERLGIQTGTRHVALKLPKNDPVTLDHVYRLDSLKVYDPYAKAHQKPGITTGTQIRPEKYPEPYKGDLVKAAAGKVLLVVRVRLASTATDDDDHLFRFGPGSLRLVTGADGPGPATDNYPIGTLDDSPAGKVMVATRADDYLFANLGNGDDEVDVVYQVNADVVVGKASAAVVADGTFVNVKRLAVLDLSGQPVIGGLPPDNQAGTGVMRTDYLTAQIRPDASK